MSQRRKAAWAGAVPRSGVKTQWMLLLGSLKLSLDKGLAWAIAAIGVMTVANAETRAIVVNFMMMNDVNRILVRRSINELA